MRAGLAIFDLDGTLVDSAPDLAAAVDRTFSAARLAPPGEGRLRSWIGDGARVMLERALAWAEPGKLPDVDWLYASFVEDYRDHIARRSTVYPGIIAALDRLEAADIVMAVATNKSESLARRLLGELGLDARFPVVVGGDTLAEKKPAAAPLLAVARATGISARESVMIGDAAADVLAGKAAGMRALAAAWGYGDREALARAAPEQMLTQPSDIPGALGIYASVV